MTVAPNRSPGAATSPIVDLHEDDGGAQAILDAMLSMSADLDLPSVLARLVNAATSLTDARYGALGVIGPGGELSEFVTEGLEPAQASLIGEHPHGRGLLGRLIDDPRPLRLESLSDHPAAVGFPADHPPMESFLGVPVAIHGTVFGNLYLTDKRTGAFTRRDERLVEALATAAGMVIDNARAYRASELRRRWLEAAADLAALLHPPIDVGAALTAVALRARQAAECAAAVVIQFDAESIPRVGAVAGTSSRNPTDLLAWLGPYARHAEERLVAAQLTDAETAAVLLPLPLHLHDSGVLVLLFDRRQASPLDLDLVTAFADQAALALDRALALGERAEHSIISERARIARDLHDVVIQRLFATGLCLETLRTASSLDSDAERTLDAAIDDLDRTIHDIRTTIFALRTSDDGSLRSRVVDLVVQYRQVLGFAPQVRTAGPVDTAVVGVLADQVVAVVREALSNVAKHAAATQVEVALRIEGGDRLVVEVFDNGVGLPAARRESGLANLRERALMLGGHLELLSSAGTCLRWVSPVSPPGA